MDDVWLTTLSAIRRSEPSWRAIAAYETPVRRHLARRWPILGSADRDDIVQEVLVAMRERIVPTYRAGVGPFRAFLGVAIDNRVRDRLRRRRDALDVELLPEEPHDPEGPPSDEDLDALDLEAELIGAVAAVHARHGEGPEADPHLVAALEGVLVRGESNKALAARLGLSGDQVKRLLQRARGLMLERLLRPSLPPLLLAPDVARAVDLTRACLREPRKAERLLEREPDSAVREAVDRFVRRLREAPGRLGAAGHDELVARLAAVFAGE